VVIGTYTVKHPEQGRALGEDVVDDDALVLSDGKEEADDGEGGEESILEGKI
jgi:hypothetical protein